MHEEPHLRLAEVRREAAHLVQSMLDGTNVSVIALTDTLIRHAYIAGASDIHMLPGRLALTICFRIDGVLTEMHCIPLSVHSELIARLKILSSMRTDEHHTAQDGRFRFAFDDECLVDVRVTLAPTYYGENAVLRLLSPEGHAGTLEELGFTPAHRALLEEAMNDGHGLILATGPTGSGKTTTLYALIAMLVLMRRSIVTIEDPIEYSIDGITQMPVNPRSGFTFAHGLRSMVRQDPDVLMVGEIRDSETARLACTAALTGHLVLSTLHTTDAASALIRIRDLGVEPYLIASSIALVVAQRLVRRICAACTTYQPLQKNEQDALDILLSVPNAAPPSSARFMRGAGCAVCGGTGYRGRIGVYEFLPVSDAVRADVRIQQDAYELAKAAHARGMVSIMQDALQKAVDGSTTIDEVLRLGHS